MSSVTWNLSKVIDALGKIFSIPDINAADMSQQKLLIFSYRDRKERVKCYDLIVFREERMSDQKVQASWTHSAHTRAHGRGQGACARAMDDGRPRV